MSVGRDAFSLPTLPHENSENRRFGYAFGEWDLVDVQGVLGDVSQIDLGIGFGIFFHSVVNIIKVKEIK